jgi:Fic family protein
MYEHPSAMERLLPSADSELADLALDLVAESARTAGGLDPVTEKTLRALFRSINSYSSNLIEGHDTHPADIERAMREDYSADPAKRAPQLESRAHIEIQEEIETRLAKERQIQICSAEFVCWIHDQFYQRLPRVFREVKDPETGGMDEVLPGELRRRDVRVGRHVPPPHSVLDHFLTRFTQVYSPEKHRGHGKLIAAAASHHRLAWIHPFLDENGRVTRLFTDAYLHAVGLQGYGLWSVSRGLARRRTDYLSHLAAADAQRRNDYDGRGNLSLEGLTGFCRFLLETCIDQARYMGELLATDGLHKRIEAYVKLRSAGALPGRPMKPAAAPVLLSAFLRGSLARGEAAALTGYSDRAGRDILGSLLKEVLLESDSPKGPVRMGLPMHAVAYLFPGVFPEDLMD